MHKSLIVLLFATLVAFVPAPTSPKASQDTAPLIPNTSQVSGELHAVVPTAAIETVPERTREDASPVRVRIPSIGLNAPVQNMGVLKNGELAVPDGGTNAVGWYAAGTVPGEQGSAVMDAHVFAALSKLRYAKIGDDIYVTANDGKELHFTIEDSRVYKLGELPPNLLFNRADDKRLNLITCAGKLTAYHSTYDHRLVVYAVLVP